MPTPESFLMLKHLPVMEANQELPPDWSALILPMCPVPTLRPALSTQHPSPAGSSSAGSSVFVWVSEGEGGRCASSVGLCLAQTLDL